MQEFILWAESLPNTQRAEVYGFLELLRITHQSSLVAGFTVNITPKNEIVFDTVKLSYGSAKRIIKEK